MLTNFALLVGVTLLAGLTPVAAKEAMSALPPLSTGFARFMTAGVLLLITERLLRRRPVRPIARRDYWRFLLAAALCVPINQFAFLVGVKWANASHTGLFYALNPMLTYLFTLAFGLAHWSRRMAFATMLAFLGAATLSFDGLRLGTRFLYGDILLFFAVASFAGYTVAMAPLAQRYGAVRTTALVMFVGGLLNIPAWFVDGAEFDLFAAPPQALLGFLYIALGTSYVNYALWVVALSRLDINRLAVAVNTAPLVAVVAAHFWLDEPLSRWLLLGGALLLCAIALANWDKLAATLRRSPSRRGVNGG